MLRIKFFAYVYFIAFHFLFIPALVLTLCARVYLFARRHTHSGICNWMKANFPINFKFYIKFAVKLGSVLASARPKNHRNTKNAIILIKLLD